MYKTVVVMGYLADAKFAHNYNCDNESLSDGYQVKFIEYYNLTSLTQRILTPFSEP